MISSKIASLEARIARLESSVRRKSAAFDGVSQFRAGDVLAQFITVNSMTNTQIREWFPRGTHSQNVQNAIQRGNEKVSGGWSHAYLTGLIPREQPGIPAGGFNVNLSIEVYAPRIIINIDIDHTSYTVPERLQRVGTLHAVGHSENTYEFIQSDLKQMILNLSKQFDNLMLEKGSELY